MSSFFLWLDIRNTLLILYQFAMYTFFVLFFHESHCTLSEAKSEKNSLKFYDYIHNLQIQMQKLSIRI